MKFCNLKNCFFLLIILSTITASAQGNLMKRADEKYQDYKYFEAIELYKEAIEKKKKSAKEAYPKIADCYYKTSQYRKASFWFKKAVDSYPNKHNYKFNYAQALMSNGEYEEALSNFKTYQKKAPSDRRTGHFIEWCSNIDKYIADSSKYQIKKLPFNSKAHEFSPTFYNGGLVFTSDRTDREKSASGQDEIYTDLYFVELNYGSRWTNVERLEGKIEGKYHEGQAVFAEDGNKMYFNRNVKKGKRNRKSGKTTSVLKIYEASWKDGKWVDVKELPFNSKDNSYSVSHPSLSADGNTMIFTSNKPGGKGGMDLYIVRKKGNAWGTPKNLGSNVNTAGNEVFPTIHDDETVYFSSNGWGGFGGLDIFQTRVKKGKFTKAQNVGYPINSPNDDSGLTLVPNKQIGYFASNRFGGRGFDDVYELFITEDKATELLADKNLVNAPSPIKSSKSVSKKTTVKEEVVNNTESEKIKAEVKETAPEEISLEELSNKEVLTGKNEKSDEKSKRSDDEPKFNPKEEVNVFVPKKDDVQIGQVYYLIGSVIEYGKDSNIIKNAIVEVIDHTNKNKAVHYADKEGNFYMNLKQGNEYTIVHTSMGKVHDFKKIDTRKKKTSEVTHIVLRGKKPEQLQQYVHRLYKKQVKDDGLDQLSSENIVRTSPKTSSIQASTNVYDSTTNYPSSNNTNVSSSGNYTYFDSFNSDRSVVYKVQLGAFKRDLSTRSNYFRKAEEIIEKEVGPNSVNRYLVGYYTDYYSAKSLNESMKSKGFNTAFVAVYINGIRQERNTEEVLKELGITP